MNKKEKGVNGVGLCWAVLTGQKLHKMTSSNDLIE